MRWWIPTRFSSRWWQAIASATVVSAAVAFVVAHSLGRDGASLFLWVLAAALIGDLLVALACEKLAPTRVDVGPGERASRDDPLDEPAIAIEAFGPGGHGRVRVRGEIWAARHASAGDGPLHGERLTVIAREGLTLLVVRRVR